MNNPSTPILRFYIPDGSEHTLAGAIDPSLDHLGFFINELRTPTARKLFYYFLKKVQDSLDSNAEETWMGNGQGCTIKKESISILSYDLEDLLTVPLPLFLRALHEWEEYLSANFPKSQSECDSLPPPIQKCP